MGFAYPYDFSDWLDSDLVFYREWLLRRLGDPSTSDDDFNSDLRTCERIRDELACRRYRSQS